MSDTNFLAEIEERVIEGTEPAEPTSSTQARPKEAVAMKKIIFW
jgi:hypothetical protein